MQITENITSAERNGAGGALLEWADTVRELLFEVRGRQGCQRPEHWPKVRQRLLEKLAPLVDDAVVSLARLFSDVPPADDPVRTVWQAFPRLDLDHHARLATLLNGARAGVGAGR